MCVISSIVLDTLDVYLKSTQWICSSFSLHPKILPGSADPCPCSVVLADQLGSPIHGPRHTLKLWGSIHPRKLTWISKMMAWKRWFLLNMAIFGIYVRFLGGILQDLLDSKVFPRRSRELEWPVRLFCVVWCLGKIEQNCKKWWLPGCFLKWWYPQNHPKMIISSGKTHGCWGYHHLRKHPPRPSGCFKEKTSVFETGLLRPNISTYRLEDSGMKHHKNPSLLVGGFSPSEKYARQIGSFPQGRDEHKKICKKPPPRDSWT